MSHAGLDVGDAGEQTTLLRDEDESFALAPVDASAIRGHFRTKRKRKLIVDDVKGRAIETEALTSRCRSLLASL